MGQIVAIAGTSHSPMLGMRPEVMWTQRAKDDRENSGLLDANGDVKSFDELQAAAGGKYDSELSEHVWNEKFEKAQACIRRLRDDIIALKPDLLVVIGDDQEELFTARNQPAIAVYHGAEMATHKPVDMGSEIMLEGQKALGMDGAVYDAHPSSALHLIETLVQSGFDVATSSETETEHGFGHAFAWVTGRVLKGYEVPTLPLLINTYFPPNQPLPARCYDLGVALRKAIETMEEDLRVVVVASGGLSHFVVDEDIDAVVLEAMKTGDADALRDIDPKRLNSGTSEIRNWIAAAGAGEHLSLSWVEYIAAYRSAAGTGVGLAFGIWQ